MQPFGTRAEHSSEVPRRSSNPAQLGVKRRIARLRTHLSFSNAISLIALFFALGGTVYAAGNFSGKTIKRGSIPANRLAPGSVGAEQVDEASLGQVPSAARAETAAVAAKAERAETAKRADRADRASLAETAARADHAPEAAAATTAEFAPTAADSSLLGGQPASAFLQRCEPGSPIAVIEVDARAEELPNRPPGFNCKGGFSVTRDGHPEGGEYEVRFDGVFNAAPFVSAFGINSAAVVTGTGPIFRVQVYSVTGTFLLAREPFVLAVF
ncbi:MAG TPA: hypothetical protein VFX45_10665 [Solirubrobacterales bacterium]|nr:hypothetical protein [Solirubrobacterales bacterium]